MSKKRREKIISILGKNLEPVSGNSFAKQLGVSRQVIVQDIAVLRASGIDIMATPHGYLLARSDKEIQKAVLAVKHTPLETMEELNIMVDHGLSVLDVLIEHPIYGEIKGYLMLKSRQDVKRFIDKLESEKAALLSTLTNGIHLHTVEYSNQEDLERARQELKKRNFIPDDYLKHSVKLL